MSIPKNSKQDWDVVTGWEKRIAVDFGSIGPSHVRWSHWTYKERDIVARKVHEIELINQAHGNKSKRADDWRKENTPIVVDFVRDGKPMPDWAHAEYRESGVPEHVEVIWKREKPGDPASKGDWSYNPPGPWEKGEDPPWSAKIKDPEYTGYMDKKYGGLMSYTERKNGDRYDTSGNLISTKESRAKEDIPNFRKFEIGRLEDVDGHWVPGPNALQKDFEEYGHNIVKTKRNPIDDANRYRKAVGLPPLKESQSDKLRAALLKVNQRPDVVVKEFNPDTGTLDEIQGSAKAIKPTKIMPGDMTYTPLEKALNWAGETHHGKAHQNRWNRVAATMGAQNGSDPYTFDDVKKIWRQFGKNAQMDGCRSIGSTTDDKDVKGMVDYHFSPAMQGNYTAADFEKLWNQKPVIVQVKGWGKAIIDPKVGIPTYWLDGDGEATETWKLVGDDWKKVSDPVVTNEDIEADIPVAAI